MSNPEARSVIAQLIGEPLCASKIGFKGRDYWTYWSREPLTLQAGDEAVCRSWRQGHDMNTRVFVATEVDGVATNISARGVGYRLFAIPSLPVPAVAELVHSGAREEKLLRADDMIRMTRSSGNRKLAELLNRNHEKIQFNLNEISQRTARAVSSGLEAILSVAPFEIVFADRVALRANLVERPTGSQASHIAEILKRAVPEAIGSMTPSAQEFIRDTASVRLSWE